jgi:hypothetical protein
VSGETQDKRRAILKDTNEATRPVPSLLS